MSRAIGRWHREHGMAAVRELMTLVPVNLRRPEEWMATRYLAGAAITGAYPFAPVALQSPASIALYGYRDRLFVGIDADETVMPDVEAFQEMIVEAFEELRACASTVLVPATEESAPAPGLRASVPDRPLRTAVQLPAAR